MEDDKINFLNTLLVSNLKVNEEKQKYYKARTKYYNLKCERIEKQNNIQAPSSSSEIEDPEEIDLIDTIDMVIYIIGIC